MLVRTLNCDSVIILNILGNWEDGLYNGQGTIYYPDGSVFKGKARSTKLRVTS